MQRLYVISMLLKVSCKYLQHWLKHFKVSF